MSFNRTFLMDESRSPDERVNYLLENMTQDEKVAQIAGVWVTALLDDNRQFSSEKATEQIGNGTGHITRIGASSFLPPSDSARLANRVQKFLSENTRLGIPAIVHEESCAGYMARGATSFPQAIGLAATWEPDLIEEMTGVIRQQMRAVGAHHALAPVLDIARDPRWGRIEETFGEDPFLISNIGLAYVRGLQSQDLREGIVATGKHFVAHGLPEGGMNWAPVHVSERELREIFLTPFKTVIKEGNIASIMNAYHELDGIPCGSSRELMVDILREELGFKGVVVSDYFTLRTLVDYHRIAHDKAEAARMGLEAGIDIELPLADCYGAPLKQALERGDISMDLVDACVRRVLTQKFDLGLFANPYVDENHVAEVYNTPDQRALSRRIAQQSIVLLKNDGLLPLEKSARTVAVIGPSADSVRLLQGDYHYPVHLIHIFNQTSSTVAPNPDEMETNGFDWNEHFPPTVTVLEGIREVVSPDTEVRYAQGCDVTGDDRSGFDEAIKAATGADVAILVIGDRSGLGQGSTIGESNDSAGLRLPGVQQELIEAIYATGTPVVLVLVSGRPYTICWEVDHVPAIVQAWLPAQEGGTAIAGVLFGDVNPGGRLPVSFPRSAGQIPVYYYHKPSGGRSNWHVDYTDLSTKPLFPFGYGLSYTTFEYSDLTLSSKQVGAEGTITISVSVRNTGDRTGDEVVQLYVSDPVATVTRPVKLLKGFKRITAEPGEQKVLHFELNVRHLAFYNRKMTYAVEPGQIDVMVGSSSDDIRLQDSFEINGELTAVEQVFVTPVHVE